jgi:hypothetical protein
VAVRRQKVKGTWYETTQRVACTYKCRRPFRAVRFQAVDAPEEYAILHPSPKVKGKWQLSLFDAEGPWGDRIRDTCSQAAQELSHVYQKWDVVDWG